MPPARERRRRSVLSAFLSRTSVVIAKCKADVDGQMHRQQGAPLYAVPERTAYSLDKLTHDEDGLAVAAITAHDPGGLCAVLESMASAVTGSVTATALVGTSVAFGS